MIATEARALTEARRAESPTDYYLRTAVYPAIEHAAAARQARTEFHASLWSQCGNRLWTTLDGFSYVDQIVARLEADGFKVEHCPCGANRAEEVRVSW